MKKCIRYPALIIIIAIIVFFFHYTSLLGGHSEAHIGEIMQMSLFGYYSGMGLEMQLLDGEGLFFIMLFVFWAVPDIWKDFVYVQDFRFSRIVSRSGWLSGKILVILRRAIFYNLEVWGIIFLFAIKSSICKLEKEDFVSLLICIIYCLLSEFIFAAAGQFITVAFNLRTGLPAISVIVLGLFALAGLNVEGRGQINPLLTWLNPMDLYAVHINFHQEMIKAMVMLIEGSLIIIAFYIYVNRMNILKRGK